MSTQLESAIVRIRTNDHTVVGAGFLASENLVLTCAYVVADALGIPRETTDMPTQVVCLDFPLVARDTILKARIVKWLPVQPDGRGDDLAGLELINVPPKDVFPAPWTAETDLWGHAFRAFGFPAGYENGVWASGVLRAKQADGWIQIEDVKQTGYFIAPGFSGTPVWDEQVHGGVGMTVAAERRSEVRAAFVIPVTRILERFPELAHQTKQPSRDFPTSQTQAAPLKIALHFHCFG